VTEPTAAAAAEADPLEDTPPGATSETGEDTPKQPAQPEDWEARYKEAQKALSRQGAELAILRRGDDAEADEGDEDDDEEPDEDSGEPASRQPEENLTQFARDSWELAEARYGPEATAAYEAAWRVLNRATTPADYIAAFEAYHEIRSGGSKKEATAAAKDSKKPSRKEALEPRVDLNRSDASPDLDDLEHQFAEATAKSDLGKFVAATTRALGFRK